MAFKSRGGKFNGARIRTWDFGIVVLRASGQVCGLCDYGGASGGVKGRARVQKRDPQ